MSACYSIPGAVVAGEGYGHGGYCLLYSTVHLVQWWLVRAMDMVGTACYTYSNVYLVQWWLVRAMDMVGTACYIVLYTWCSGGW